MKHTLLLLSLALLALAPAPAPAQRIHPRVEAYMERCNPLVGDPVILSMADTLERLSLELGDTEGIVSAPVLPFHYYLHTAQEDSMEHYAGVARERALKYGRTDYYFMVWERYIAYHAGRRRYSLALRELDEMHRMAIDLGDPDGELSCYKNLALVYYYKNNLEQAEGYTRKAIAASKKIKDNDYETGLCLVELARILTKAGRPEQAVEELEEAMPTLDRRLKTSGENDLMMALLGSMLTSAKVAQGDLTGASEALSQVDKHLQGSYHYYDIMKAHSDYYCAAGRYREALDWQRRFYDALGTTHTFTYYKDMSEILMHIPGQEREAARLVRCYVEFADSVQAAEQEAYFEEVAADMDLYRLEAENQRLHLRTSQALLCASLIMLLLVATYATHSFVQGRRLRASQKTRRQLEQELSEGQAIQDSILQHRFPDAEHYEICAALRPAHSMSGDLYDFVERDGRLYFIIADVSGQGAPAALWMSAVTYTFRAELDHCATAAKLMERINQVVGGENPHNMFATALCGILDPAKGQLSLCNAGHCQPLGMSRLGDKATPYTLQRHQLEVNLPIGVQPGTRYTDRTLRLNAGDKFFLYTNGLVEAEDSQHAPFGEERLTALLTAHNGTTAREIVDLVDQSVQAHIGGAPHHDDITLFAIVYKQ